jgi:hypothetical protein
MRTDVAGNFKPSQCDRLIVEMRVMDLALVSRESSRTKANRPGATTAFQDENKCSDDDEDSDDLKDEQKDEKKEDGKEIFE